MRYLSVLYLLFRLCVNIFAVRSWNMRSYTYIHNFSVTYDRLLTVFTISNRIFFIKKWKSHALTSMSSWSRNSLWCVLCLVSRQVPLRSSSSSPVLPPVLCRIKWLTKLHCGVTTGSHTKLLPISVNARGQSRLTYKRARKAVSKCNATLLYILCVSNIIF